MGHVLHLKTSITSTSPQLPTHPKHQKTITFHESFVKVSDLVSNRLETSGLASKQNIDSLTSEMLLNVFSHILCFLFITVISGRYIQKFLRENRALHRVNRNQGFQLNFFQKTEWQILTKRNRIEHVS